MITIMRRFIFWLGLIGIVLFNTHCSFSPPPDLPPLKIIGLTTNVDRTQLSPNNVIYVIVEVENLLASPPASYQWSATGGQITNGQGTNTITYQTPDQSGSYELEVTIIQGGRSTSKALLMTVVTDDE